MDRKNANERSSFVFGVHDYNIWPRKMEDTEEEVLRAGGSEDFARIICVVQELSADCGHWNTTSLLIFIQAAYSGCTDPALRSVS